MRFLTRSLIGVFLLALTLGLVSWAALSIFSAFQARMAEENGERPSRERVFAVDTITIAPATLTPVMTVFGEIDSRRTLELRTAVAGVVIEVAENFEEGGQVNAGQLVVRIDPADAQATFERAQADLQESQAEVRDAARNLDLSQQELAAAEEQNLLRQRAFERQRDLRDRGVGTDASVEDAELSASTARQAVVSRRQALAQAEARVDLAQTRLLREEIDLAEAQRRLDDTEIYAAFDGTLTNVDIVQGARINASEQIARLIDPDQLEVRFRLSTAQYVRLLDPNGGLKPAPLIVSLEVFGVDHTSQGIISRESAEVGDGQTGRLLFATLDRPQGFRPGDFVTVRIEEPPLDNVVMLPAAAVAADQSVLVIGPNDRLQLAQVEVLRRQDNDVIVRAPGLDGQDVVSERSPLLGEGIRVRRIGPSAETLSDTPDMLQLTPERRAKLVAFVEQNQQMPAEAKARILSQLQGDMVPAQVVARLENRMGS
ncbi:efflux RND transporter periplasmic adaptor subunit [Pseudaestuariivita rosea]|uniref:efflux RND transporter periplasmic adaptor subunit n=1 Tax=Pseudaestuariivita rosea TaxID=2763263 RepID=UPI001ABB18CC|nr:HlyD family efflux transporter periplasmic adaptor subunit [Pseudaestuariivita rosea]